MRRWVFVRRQSYEVQYISTGFRCGGGMVEVDPDPQLTIDSCSSVPSQFESRKVNSQDAIKYLPRHAFLHGPPASRGPEHHRPR
jgi:hypothetical protein